MTGLRLIQVPYDSGVRERRMGRGPFHFAENGALNVIDRIVDEGESVVIEYKMEFPIEVATTFGLKD